MSKLKEARQILSKRGSWIKGSLAQSRDGENVEPNNPKAEKFCSLGALARVGVEVHHFYDYRNPSSFSREQILLERAAQKLRGESVIELNDEYGQRKSFVLEMFDLAICMEECGE